MGRRGWSLGLAAPARLAGWLEQQHREGSAAAGLPPPPPQAPLRLPLCSARGGRTTARFGGRPAMAPIPGVFLKRAAVLVLVSCDLWLVRASE